MTRRQRGLTMIEVLAAMVIFSSGAVVLFGWISQTAQRLAIVNKEQSELFSELAALEYLRTLNPTRRPTGEESIGEATFRWQSTPVGSEQPTRNPAGTDGIYMVRLYKVQYAVEAAGIGAGGSQGNAGPPKVSLTPAGGGLGAEKTLWLAGWRQMRAGRVADPFTGGRFPTQPVPVQPAPPASPAPPR